MRSELNIAGTEGSAMAIVNELDTEYGEQLIKDGIRYRKSGLFLANLATPSVVMLTITSAAVAGTIGAVLATYAVRMIDRLVEKHKQATEAKQEKLNIQVVYEVKKQQPVRFFIPSETREAIAFIKSKARSESR